jgi:hypothetical protein
MSVTTQRLSGVEGFSIEVAGPFREVPELEVGPVCVVAQAEPWRWPEEFRPTLTAEVTPLTPDRATLPQLSALAIAEQIALGAHVAACDIWLGPGDEPDGRRITSVYPAMCTTVVGLHYLTIRGDRAITVSVQHAAGNHKTNAAVWEYAVKSIRCDFADSPPQPDPATMPRLDPFARTRGMEVEYLGGIRAAQPFRSAGPPLDHAQLDVVRRGKVRRGVDPAPLQAGGLVNDRGRLTEMGEAAHEALTARTRREVTIEVVTDDDPRVATLHAYQLRESATVVASAPPGEPDAGATVDVIAPQTTPIALARWLGLAPAWTFGIAEGDAPTLHLDPAVLDARLTSSDAPPPADANENLVRMWAQQWQVASLRAGQPGPREATVITTPEAGSFRLERDRAAGEASLTPLPSAQYLLELLSFGGFNLSAS